jgi:hypothetical protein
MPYYILEHRHKFAAWADSRAASVNGCRFTVIQGKTIIENANLNNFILSPAVVLKR